MYSQKRLVKLTKIGLAGRVACKRYTRNICRNLAGRLEEKRPLGRIKHREENNIKTVLRKL